MYIRSLMFKLDYHIPTGAGYLQYMAYTVRKHNIFIALQN